MTVGVQFYHVLALTVHSVTLSAGLEHFLIVTLVQNIEIQSGVTDLPALHFNGLNFFG